MKSLASSSSASVISSQKTIWAGGSRSRVNPMNKTSRRLLRERGIYTLSPLICGPQGKRDFHAPPSFLHNIRDKLIRFRCQSNTVAAFLTTPGAKKAVAQRAQCVYNAQPNLSEKPESRYTAFYAWLGSVNISMRSKPIVRINSSSQNHLPMIAPKTGVAIGKVVAPPWFVGLRNLMPS